jgi:hypothetical protein
MQSEAIAHLLKAMHYSEARIKANYVRDGLSLAVQEDGIVF